MVREFDKLTSEEKHLLFIAPVIVSVLASCSYKKVNEAQKADAIKLAHLKTFTAFPLLLPYYIEVEKVFSKTFDILVKQYYPFDDAEIKLLKEELQKINTIIAKLDKVYAQTLYKGLEKYTTHVKRAAHSVFQDFLFPINIPGLNN